MSERHYAPAVDGKEVCDPYATQAEAEAFGSGYATALRNVNGQIVEVEIVEYEFTEADGYTEIKREAL